MATRVTPPAAPLRSVFAGVTPRAAIGDRGRWAQKKSLRDARDRNRRSRDVRWKRGGVSFHWSRIAMEAQGRKNLRSEEALSSGNPRTAAIRQEDEIVKGSRIYGEFRLEDQPGIDHRLEGVGGKVLQKEKIKRGIEKSPTMRCTEYLPVSRLVLGRYAPGTSRATGSHR